MEAIVELIVNLPVEDILNIDMDLEQKIAREFLECQICMDRCKNPKDLNCRHFFCQECLTKLVATDKTSTIKCPTCRKFTPIPEDGGIANLPSNFYVSSLADVVKRTANAATSTAASGDESTEKESSSSSSAASTRVSSPKISMKTCTKHSGKELGMVCMTCMDMVCYVCMMESHQQPQHKCKLFQKAIEESKTCLSSFEEQLRLSAAQGQRYLDAIEENRGILNENANQVLQAIQASTTETIRAIYSRSDELIKDVKKIKDGVGDELTGLTDSTTARLADVMKKLDAIEQVLKKEEDIDIISCSMVMEESGSSCMKYKSVPQDINFVQFVKQELGDDGGLGTLQPLQIVIIGRDDLNNDDKDSEEGDDDDDSDKETCDDSEKEMIILNDMVETDDDHGHVCVRVKTDEGVDFHRINMVNYESKGLQFAGHQPGIPEPHAMSSPHQGPGFSYQSVPMTPVVPMGPMAPAPNLYTAARQPLPHGQHGPSMAPAPVPYNGPSVRPSYGPTSMVSGPYTLGIPAHPTPLPTRPVTYAGRIAAQPQRMNYPVSTMSFVPRAAVPYMSNAPRGPGSFRPNDPNASVPMTRQQQPNLTPMRQPCPALQPQQYAPQHQPQQYAPQPQPQQYAPQPQQQPYAPQQYARFPGNLPNNMNRGVVPQQQGLQLPMNGNPTQRASYFAGAPLVPMTQHPLPDFMGSIPEISSQGYSPNMPPTSSTMSSSGSATPPHGPRTPTQPESPNSGVDNKAPVENASTSIDELEKAADLQNSSSSNSSSNSGSSSDNNQSTNNRNINKSKTPKSPSKGRRPCPEQNQAEN